jgi:hypothetical protein
LRSLRLHLSPSRESMWLSRSDQSSKSQRKGFATRKLPETSHVPVTIPPHKPHFPGVSG